MRKSVLAVSIGMLLFSGNVFAQDKSFEVYKQGVRQGAVGQFEEARQSFERFNQENPRSDNSTSLGDDGLFVLGQLKDGEIDALSAKEYFLGTDFLVRKNFREAMMVYDQLYQRNQKSAFAANAYGLGLLYNGDYQNAVVYFEKAIDSDSNYRDAYENAVFAYKSLNNADKVRKYEADLARLENHVAAGAKDIRSGKNYSYAQTLSALKKEAVAFNFLDPVADMQKNVAAGDKRYLLVCNYACYAPGALPAGVITESNSRIIQGTTDVIQGEEHLHLIEKVTRYAEQYNDALLSVIRKGKE